MLLSSEVARKIVKLKPIIKRGKSDSPRRQNTRENKRIPCNFFELFYYFFPQAREIIDH